MTILKKAKHNIRCIFLLRNDYRDALLIALCLIVPGHTITENEVNMIRNEVQKLRKNHRLFITLFIKFYNNVFLYVGLKTLGTFIEF